MQRRRPSPSRSDPLEAGCPCESPQILPDRRLPRAATSTGLDPAAARRAWALDYNASVRDLRQRWDLVSALVLRELKIRYRRSSLGFLWTMLQPLMLMLVLHLVFSNIFRFDVENYPVYVLSGILFWSFFSQSIVHAMNSLKGSKSLLTKLPVPKSVFPAAAVLAGALNFLFALVPLFLLLLVTGHPLTPALLFLPVALVIASLFTLGAGLLLSPLAVFFSDVVEFVGVGLTMLMYLTPIFYPIEIVPDGFRWVVELNPVRSILELFRGPIFMGSLPALGHLAVACLLTASVLLAGILVFRRSASRIPFYI